MAIDKEKIKKQHRKKIYEKNKRNVRRSADFDLNPSGSKDNTIGVTSDKKKLYGKTVKGVEKHIYSDNNGNEDTAKQNVELYKNGSEKAVSKAASEILPSHKPSDKQSNISHKSNMLSGNKSTKRTTKNDSKKRYKKNRKRIYRNKTKAAKKANAVRNETVKKIQKKLAVYGAKAMLCSSGFLMGVFILLMPLILLIMIATGGNAYNQSQAVAEITYPAEDSDITQAVTYWQSLQVSLKNQLSHVPDLSSVKDKFKTKKSSVCEFMNDSNALLSFISAYYVPYEDSWNYEDAQMIMDEVFDKMYAIEYTLSGDKLEYKISEKTSWEDILKEYLDESQKMRYDNYYNSKGGAIKAFSSPFAFDWSGYISSPFGYRDWGNGDIEFHKGVDFGVSHGTEELAIADGTVVKICNSSTHDYPKDDSCGCGGGYGNYVDIFTNDGYYITYGHMADVYVNVGDTVKNGQPVGTAGCTGWSTGVHLHLEIHLGGEQGQLIDPLTYIQDYVPIEQKEEKHK